MISKTPEVNAPDRTKAMRKPRRTWVEYNGQYKAQAYKAEFYQGQETGRNARNEAERLTLRAQCPYHAGTPRAASWLAGFAEAP
jgi:hypothetical protein